MEEKAKRQLRAGKGFTLAETLLAVLILLMVSVIVAAGIPAAKRAYERVVLASNAEVLLSTTVSTLRNELSTSQNIELPDPQSGETAKDNTVIVYYNPTRGAFSKIYVDSDGDQEIMFQRYFGKDGMSAHYDPAALISAKTATADLYVTYTKVSYADGILTFEGLSVNRRSGASGLASRETLSIRVISN